MFEPARRQTYFQRAIALGELIFHSAVHDVRKRKGNAVLGLVMTIVQAAVMIMVFYFMMSMFGTRKAAIRGDFMLYVMSGVMIYQIHTKSVSAITGSDGPTSAMMKHSPMNTLVAIISSAIGALYLQMLSIFAILYFYHTIVNPITIDQPVQMMGIVLLAWGYGIAIGMVLKAAMPWQPEFFGILGTVYRRANIVASGKMLVANTTPEFVRQWFDWNPLFHIIDQSRGYMFLNYSPHFTNIGYPVKMMLAMMVLGLMIEFYTRKHISLSWGKRG